MKNIPIQFFKPIGNPLVVVSNRNKFKLELCGNFGKLLGFNFDLKSYRIQLSNGKIIDSKNVQSLDFDSSKTPSAFDLSNLIEERKLDQGEKVDPPCKE